MKWRAEDFGAIIQIDDPPALVHVDQEMARSLNIDGGDRWSNPRGWLSGPTEVHLLLTERCPLACPGCYVGATPDGPEPELDEVKAILDKLAEAGVFHVALGGGESLLRDDLYEIAAYARELGMVPNLTTSGLGMTRKVAQKAGVFGQINVSLDGVGQTYKKSRGYDGSAGALRALRLLNAAGVSCGVNMVLCAWTWDSLEDTIKAVLEAGGQEIELLRFKPTGRGRDGYLDRKLSLEQAKSLFPELARLGAKYPGINLKVDCSFVPFICAGGVSVESLVQYGVIGCEAGNVLSAVRADGRATACSFIEDGIGDVNDLVDQWDTHPVLHEWRSYAKDAPHPCNTCEYLPICKGGCKAVSAYYGDVFSPDPECPRVIAALGPPRIKPQEEGE